jgi:Uma2 family endonuclease
MAQPKPRLKFTVNDYMSAPPGKRYQLLDGEMILMEGGADLAPAPSDKHQSIVVELLAALHRFITENSLGQIRVSPYDVVLSDNDVVQPDLLFVSRERAGIITRANVQGAPDLVVEVLSPGTAQYDRGYKRTLYGRHGVREYWLVDPEAETIEVLTRTGRGLGLRATYHRGETLTSPLLAGLTLDLDQIFG